jgi:hypothetical protein
MSTVLRRAQAPAASPSRAASARSSRAPAAIARASSPTGAASWTEAGSPCSAGPQGSASARPAQRVEGVGEADHRIADLEVVPDGGRGDEGERRRDEQVHPLNRVSRPLPILLQPAQRGLELGVRHRQAALELRSYVLAVGVGVVGEQPAVRLGRLAHEHRPVPLGERERDGPTVWEELRRRLDAGPHERLGELQPGDAHLEVLQRAQLGAVKAGRERLKHARARLDVAPHRARVVEAGRERKAAVELHEPAARLEADDAAAGGGDADRAARVRAESGVCQAVASAAAEPALDPPAVRSRASGFTTAPKCGL